MQRETQQQLKEFENLLEKPQQPGRALADLQDDELPHGHGQGRAALQRGDQAVPQPREGALRVRHVRRHPLLRRGQDQGAGPAPELPHRQGLLRPPRVLPDRAHRLPRRQDHRQPHQADVPVTPPLLLIMKRSGVRRLKARFSSKRIKKHNNFKPKLHPRVIAPDLNTELLPFPSTKVPEPEPLVQIEPEFVSKEDLQNLIAQQIAGRARIRLNSDQRRAAEQLQARHGADYELWQKDMKLNVMQWNQNQSRAKHELLLRLRAAQM